MSKQYEKDRCYLKSPESLRVGVLPDLTSGLGPNGGNFDSFKVSGRLRRSTQQNQPCGSVKPHPGGSRLRAQAADGQRQTRGDRLLCGWWSGMGVGSGDRGRERDPRISLSPGSGKKLGGNSRRVAKGDGLLQEAPSVIRCGHLLSESSSRFTASLVRGHGILCYTHLLRSSARRFPP